MHPLIRHLVATPLCRGAIAAACAVSLLAGCEKAPAPKVHRISYPDIGLKKNLPVYLKDTVLERTELSNTAPLAVTTFGLVVNLRYSGDSRATTPVREWMIKEMYRHGMGNLRIPGYKEMTPERVLADKRTAVVMAAAYIPPGARKGQRVDVICQALRQSDTGSLAGGVLYQSELRIDGANELNPGGSVNKYVEARGPVFINPAYALETPKATEGVARSGARTGTILGGGIVTTDRPLHLVLRTPQYNIARSVEIVINQRFQAVADRPRQDGKGMCVAEAQDDGYLQLYPPVAYNGSWEHFAAVATHLYLTMNPALGPIKAQELVAEAQKPGALLEDISYALEGIGPMAIPYITPLLNHPAPDVRYAMARAGAYLGDQASEDTLIRIAQQPGHPFRVNAILALGELPNNSEINRVMALCLDSEESLVRINAYKILAANDDPHVTSTRIKDSLVLDQVDSKGPPLIYASRIGEPRLAIFGSRTTLQQPLTFTAFDSQLTISTPAAKPNVLSIFYRGDELPEPVQTLAYPKVADLAARLAGADEKLHFGYGDIVGILQSLSDSGRISAPFVLQDQPGVGDALAETPDATGGGREIGEPAPATRPVVPPTVGVNTGPAAAGNGVPAVRPN